MSIQIAIDNINLIPNDRWAHSEYSLNYHHRLLKKRTGLEKDDPGLPAAIDETFQLDFTFLTNDGLIEWDKTGRVTDMGHATYASDGSDRRDPRESPFKTPEDVWAYDAVSEYGLPQRGEQISAYQKHLDQMRQTLPRTLVPGGTYRTIVSGGIAAFGWDMLLLACSEPAKMEKVFDSFFRRTLFNYGCWVETDAEVFITHDDFVWTAGPFMNPDIYRNVIIPRYAELWKLIHGAGKKVLFCSDGDFTLFADDIANAGADGFIFEPMMDFSMMVEKFGTSHCLAGSCVDCRDLTFNNRKKVKRDIDKTFELLKKCRGVIVAVGNHLPPNIPEPMMEFYFAEVLPRLIR